MTKPKRSIRLSRGQKIVRNLLLAVLAGFLVWVNAGAPLPPELAFFRLVRANFWRTRFSSWGILRQAACTGVRA